LSTRGEGRHSLSVEGRSKNQFLTCFGHGSIKIMLNINRERSKKIRKISVLGITNHKSATVRGGGGRAPGALPMDLLVIILNIK